MYTKINDVKIYYNFNDGIKVSVVGPDDLYYVELREYKSQSDSSRFVQGIHVTSKNISGQKKIFNVDIKFFMDFEIFIYKCDFDKGLTLIWSHRFNDRDKLVKFVISSDNKEESELWVQKSLAYCKHRGCKPIIESKFDDLNKLTNYFFAIEGAEPYKTYKIGRFPKSSNDWKTIDDRYDGILYFGNWKSFWSYEHPRRWNFLNSKEIVDDILGL